MDVTELIDSWVEVPAQFADKQQLPCVLCSDDLGHAARLRATPHRPCLLAQSERSDGPCLEPDVEGASPVEPQPERHLHAVPAR